MEVRSKTYYVAKRLAKAVLLRSGLELKRVQTQDQIKRQIREARREARSQLKEARKEEARRQIREAVRRGQGAPGWHPANLRKPGFSPRTVFDVGVLEGTPTLYEAFSEAFQVLIEPLKEYEPHLKGILQEYEGEYFLTAVGARDEELTINVESDSKARSSFYSRTSLSHIRPVEKRVIPVTTLDALIEKHDFQPPFGLKIDTEGFEYQVIKGSPNFLRETQFVIAEVSVGEVYEEGYSFADFIKLMDENGFSLCDIIYIKKRKSFGEAIMVDAMFKKANRATSVPLPHL